MRNWGLEGSTTEAQRGWELNYGSVKAGTKLSHIVVPVTEEKIQSEKEENWHQRDTDIHANRVLFPFIDNIVPTIPRKNYTGQEHTRIYVQI